MKTYWGTILRQIRYLEWKKEWTQIMGKVVAPIEHLFNNHQSYDKNGITSSRLRRRVNLMSLKTLNHHIKKCGVANVSTNTKGSIERFKKEENIIECPHKYTTLNRMSDSTCQYQDMSPSTNTAAHLRISPDTRIRCLIGSYNMGYSTFLSTF